MTSGPVNSLIILRDVHDFLIDILVQLLASEQFVTVAGGNVFDDEHVILDLSIIRNNHLKQNVVVILVFRRLLSFTLVATLCEILVGMLCLGIDSCHIMLCSSNKENEHYRRRLLRCEYM